MMTAMPETLDVSPRRVVRFSAAFVCALTVHVALVAIAIMGLGEQVPEDGGLFAIDMPPLAVENATAASDNSELAQDATTAPPPSDADDTLPAEAEAANKVEPDAAEAAPEPPTETAEAPEPATQPAEQTVPEAPNAPEPDVVLPKAAEQPTETKAPEEPKPEVKKPAETKVADRKTEVDKTTTKSGPKSNSKAASSAAASGGKFSANAISRPHPPYPSSARASRIEGSVVVRYTVAPSGAVTGVSIVSASPPGVFNAVTLSAVRSWRFRPSATGGSGTTTVRFKLR